MKIVQYTLLRGANVFSYKPVLWIKLDLEEACDKPSTAIEGLKENLLLMLPGLYEHKCAVGKRGGFVQRLQEGTYPAHIFEHMVLELQNSCGDAVAYGKARATAVAGIYDVVVAYFHEEVAVKCALLAEKMFNALLAGRRILIDEDITAIQALKEKCALGPSALAIYEAAVRRGIPVERFAQEDLLFLGQGKHRRKVWSSVTDRTSLVAADLVGNKYLTARLLADHGIPVPSHRIVASESEALAAWHYFGSDVVLKPLNGSHGRGVTIGIESAPVLRKAFQFALQYDSQVLVEEFVSGRQYRLCVVAETLVAAAERIPAYVIGDGCHTVKELVDLANKNPLRGEGHDKPLTKIKIDNAALNVLAKQDLSSLRVPEAKRVVKINETANLSTGGTAVDVTAIVHPDTVAMAEYIAQVVGLDVMGLDIIAQDIAKPLAAQRGAVIEVNAAPGLRMHHHPSGGQARDVGGKIVESFFPRGCDGRIPIVAVTGTNGKTTTVRMIGSIFREAGFTVGMTTTEGVFINDSCLLKGDCSGPASAKMVLAHNKVGMAVLETARGGIVRAGLGFDRCDIGVVTNISDDHLGQDGVESLEDLAHIKSLVLEMVKPSGAAVINADDKFAVKLAARVQSNVIYFSNKSDNILVRRHLGVGGKAVFVKNEEIWLAQGAISRRLLRIQDMPAAFSGMAKHNIENALAAAGAAFGCDMEIEFIRGGLLSFSENIGRLHMFSFDSFQVCVDYGHNPAGYDAVIKTARLMCPRRLVGVIAAPGDRQDKMIFALGQVAGAGFDALYIKEDADLRGRKPGETAELLRRGAVAAGFSADNINIVLLEEAAVQAALEQAEAGDLIVVFYERYDTVLQVLKEYQATKQETDTTECIRWPDMIGNRVNKQSELFEVE